MVSIHGSMKRRLFCDWSLLAWTVRRTVFAFAQTGADFHLLRTCRLAVFLQQSEMAWMPRTNFPLTNRHEPRHDKICLREFPTRSDSNWPAQLHVQKLACGLKFWLQKQETLHYQGSEQQRRWSDCADFGYDIRHVFHGPAHIDFPSLIITSSRRLVSCSGGFW